MTWTAPEPPRGHPKSFAGNEREMLESWLEWHRATLLMKCGGLTAKQLAERSVPPSNLSLLGLLRHMTSVEQGWFLEKIGGQEVDRIRDDSDFDAADPANASADYTKYLAVLESTRAVAGSAELDDAFRMPRWDADLSVRWVFVHMIEEYARHNGHADFLRECVDGTTGY